MLTYPEIDPVAFGLGPLKVHWYGLTYLAAFALFWLLGHIRAKQPHSKITPEQVGDILFYGALGVIVGGRLGYILFYNFPQFMADPLMILRIWQGGMSFHGGMLGVFVAMALYGRRYKLGWFTITDFIAPLVPLGLASGRVGNFINGELWGRVTDVPWGMVFGHVGPEPRHPSQVYQVLLEGVALFTVLWLYSRHPRPTAAVSGVFLAGYGFFRFIAEFFRQPDEHLGYIAFNWLTMGQILTLPMIVIGLLMVAWAYRRQAVAA